MPPLPEPNQNSHRCCSHDEQQGQQWRRAVAVSSSLDDDGGLSCFCGRRSPQQPCCPDEERVAAAAAAVRCVVYICMIVRSDPHLPPHTSHHHGHQVGPEQEGAVLTRDFIFEALYSPTNGYFGTKGSEVHVIMMGGGRIGVSAAPCAKSFAKHMYTYVAGTACTPSISINASVHPFPYTLPSMYPPTGDLLPAGGAAHRVQELERLLGLPAGAG